MIGLRIDVEAARRELRAAYARVGRRVIAPTLREACRVLAQQIHAQAPRLSGDLAADVRVVMGRISDRSVTCRVIVGGRVGYAVPVEFGHGDADPVGFVAEAVEARRSEVEALIARELVEGIAREYSALR